MPPRLAVRNLLRGYRLRMPTGQAVAKHMGLPVLSAAQLKAAAISDDQREQARRRSCGGRRCGTTSWPRPSTTAAIGWARSAAPSSPRCWSGLVRRSQDSILSVPNWKPSLPSASPGEFELTDLLRFAGVLGAKTTTRTYKVKAGDTLTKIAQKELGDGDRWREIFLLNRATIRDPDRIQVGQVLVLPVDSELERRHVPPQVYVVKRGDTLSGIAAAELGDAEPVAEIFALNKAVLTKPDLIVPGTVLVLP